MVLLISYDLNKHERPEAYAVVKKVIEDNAIDTKRPLYSQWFVETDDSCATWRDRIRNVCDDDDNVLVVKVTKSYAGYISKSIWTWLEARL